MIQTQECQKLERTYMCASYIYKYIYITYVIYTYIFDVMLKSKTKFRICHKEIDTS